MPVSVSQTIDLTSALALVGLDDYRLAGDAARCVLASRPEHRGIIDGELAQLWQSLSGWHREDQEQTPTTTLADLDPHRGGAEPGAAIMPSVPSGARPSSPKPSDIGEPLFSPIESLRRKDIAAYTPAELEEAERFLKAMRWRPPLRRSRRRRPSTHGREPDMRRFLRLGLARGGDLVELPRQSRQTKPRPLIVLCDISGSMNAYTRMLLRFLHALQGSCARTEVFVFSTRLTRITRFMAGKNPDVAMDQVSAEVRDWSGGTRIGEAISTFNRRWARRVAAHGAVIIMISDGWDRGEPERLAQEMKRMNRLSHRLIWLNPLIGNPSYQPLTRGIVAARPFIDDFLPMRDLASLESLASVLNGLDDSRRRTGVSDRG